ncbi:hypothetical protein F4861DRAFT_244970 [Xylaria intraflava]|nr:hypothetical protein F4861DRAFT_244970 [Xylaria intraflava]
MALASITHVVDCLLRLWVPIRNAPAHDQFTSQAGKQALAIYAEHDMRHAEANFPNIDIEIARRLGRSITASRQFFRHRGDEYARLTRDRDAMGDDDNDGDFWQGFDTTNDNLTSTSSYAPSTTSFAPSHGNSEHLAMPPEPNGYLNRPVLCPFCYSMILVSSRHHWHKHVYSDLRPYVCLAPRCPMQNHKFSRRSNWIHHMMQSHWRIWRCLYCQEAADTLAEYWRHLQTHLGTLTVEERDVIEKLASQPDPGKASCNCPLCNSKLIASPEEYSTHVGNHLQQLSLFALPSFDHDENERQDHDESARPTQVVQWDQPFHWGRRSGWIPSGFPVRSDNLRWDCVGRPTSMSLYIYN